MKTCDALHWALLYISLPNTAEELKIPIEFSN